MEFTLDSEPVKPPKVHLYAERVIHGCIYQARPDVMAVCHHHAPAIMPFAIAGKPIVPVFHLGAAMGEETPFWDQHDEFGDTNLLVVKQEEGHSLARALGQHSAVMMNRHGATVVGSGFKELVSRSIFMCQNAEYQLRALLLGTPAPLHPARSSSPAPSAGCPTWCRGPGNTGERGSTLHRRHAAAARGPCAPRRRLPVKAKDADDARSVGMQTMSRRRRLAAPTEPCFG